jgi:hypothetical protein
MAIVGAAVAGTLLLLAGCGTLAAQAPMIRRVGQDHRLTLPPATQTALEHAAPGFTPWTLDDYHQDIRQGYTFTMRQAPWAVIGDFNGDGTADVVIDGYTSTEELRVVVLSQSGGPRVLTLVSGPRQHTLQSRAEVLQFVAPGVVGTNFTDATKLIFTDAFNVYYWEKAGVMYYWEDGHFHEFATSD